MKPLQTPRLVLTEPREDDRDAFAAMNADPRVMRFFPATMTRAESDAMLDRIRTGLATHGFGFWFVRRREDPRLLGFVGLAMPTFEAPFMPCVEIGWRLVVDAWGQGYATEAAHEALRCGFEEHGLREIVSFTALVNEPSWKVMQRLGMTRDANEDFDHPRVPEGHALRRHVLYRLPRPA
jgi:RimJ/RimL family protein N-acetyltransferase